MTEDIDEIVTLMWYRRRERDLTSSPCILRFRGKPVPLMNPSPSMRLIHQPFGNTLASFASWVCSPGAYVSTLPRNPPRNSIQLSGPKRGVAGGGGAALVPWEFGKTAEPWPMTVGIQLVYPGT